MKLYYCSNFQVFLTFGWSDLSMILARFPFYHRFPFFLFFFFFICNKKTQTYKASTRTTKGDLMPDQPDYQVAVATSFPGLTHVEEVRVIEFSHANEATTSTNLKKNT